MHAVNPKALIYGEGWTGGTSPLRDNFRANQANIKQVTASGEGIGAIAVFNDAIRDGLKGSVFDPKDTGYANGSANKTNANKVIFGIRGGEKTSAVSWGVKNSMVVNYTSSHDNNTLWDKLLVSCPYVPEADHLAMNRLCAATVLLSRGIPFFLAGEEMLRTKDGDSNSYKSSDTVNNLDWDSLASDSAQRAMSEYYRVLIAERKNNAFLTSGAAPECELLDGNAIAVTWLQDEKAVAFALINPNAGEAEAAVPDGWSGYTVLIQNETAAPEGAAIADTLVRAAPKSVTLVIPAAD